MRKPKTQDLLIIVLIIAVVILSSFLVIGFNRMTAQARTEATYANLAHFSEREEAQRLQDVDRIETGEDVPERRPPPIGLIIEELESGEVKLTYQGSYTQPNVLDESGESGAGIGVQSTNSGSEFIPSSAFRPDGFTGPSSEYRFWPTAGYVRNNSAFAMCLAAPVYLPDGATITTFYMYFVDSHATEDTWQAYLRRRGHTSPLSNADTVRDLDFLDNLNRNEIFIIRGSSSLVVTPGSDLVSNSYGYHITYCFQAGTGFDHRIYGFRVDYTMP